MTTAPRTTKTKSATAAPAATLAPATGATDASSPRARDQSTPATQAEADGDDVVVVTASSPTRRTEATNASPPPPAKRAKGKTPLKRSPVFLPEASPSSDTRAAAKDRTPSSVDEGVRLKAIMAERDAVLRNELNALKQQLYELKSIMLQANANAYPAAPTDPF